MILNCIQCWSSSSGDLPLLPGPLGLGEVIVSMRIPSMGQIDLSKNDSYSIGILDPIYPTPPLGQDMTQGQFLSGV